VFNDDIQGTAATALAGMYGAMRVMGLPKADLAKQRVVVCGTGSAGMGVIDMIAMGMQRHGLTRAEACAQFWVLDAGGLVTRRRSGLAPHVAEFAREEEEMDGMGLADVIRAVRPSALLGLTGAGRIWGPEVLSAMADATEHPIVFPMSNPTSKMECTAEQAQEHTGGRAIFASGSPQAPVQVPGAGEVASSQANNMFVFPGLALGAFLAKCTVSDGMLMAAAGAVTDCLPESLVRRRGVYPDSNNIRMISAHVALAVLKQARNEGLIRDWKVLRRLDGDSDDDDDSALRWIHRSMYVPLYGPIVTLPPGINE